MTNSKLAFVFPGQGSQSVGMLSALAAQFPLVEETFHEAGRSLDYDLWDLVENGPEDRLNTTENTQPALLTAGVATWRVWLEQGGLTPALMAGHSLGEYSALVCAGSLLFNDAVSLVADRGRLMQSAVPEGEGAMAAILGLDGDELETLCSRAAEGQIVSPANFNSPGQIVIAGDTDAVKRAIELAAAAGAKRTILLPVSVPSHCALMRDAAKEFAERMNNITIETPTIQVLHNIDASSRSDATMIKIALAEQLYQPVRWIETIKKMKEEGITHIIECGPGNVLSGLIKRIDRTIEVLPVYNPPTLVKALETTRDLD